jgi:hypothetical protein
MSNDWINRLVVRGPAGEVNSFATAATDPRIVRHQLARPLRSRPGLGLCFSRLLARLPVSVKARLNSDITEPWDLSIDPPERLEGGMIERIYRFQLRHYEPDSLLVEISRQYPKLCFVLGWVDPNADDQASRFIHVGRSPLYRLSQRRKRVLQAAVPKDGYADDVETFWASVHADWAMMDAVVSHWDRKSAAALRRITRESARFVRRPRRRKRTS